MADHPTESGYYWARMRSPFHAAPTWQPVQLARLAPAVLAGEVATGATRWDVYVLGDDLVYALDEVTEWGARIERPA